MPAYFDEWTIPARDLRLEDDTVHVWRISIPEPSDQVLPTDQILSRAEQAKACRFHFALDRHKYVYTHAAVRQILSEYLHQCPAQIEFSYTDYGKPYVAKNDDEALRFNLSHSGGLALLGIARSREIGVDVEQLREKLVDPRVAKRFFAPNESNSLLAMPEGERIKAFFNCWTRKEAFVKGIGEGLSYPLNQFEVSLTTEDPFVHLKTYKNPQDSEQWKIRHLAPGDGYTGAVAVQGNAWTLKCWQWKIHS